MAGVRGVLYICAILYSSSFCRPIKEGDMKVLNNDLLPKDRIPGVKLERDGDINRDFHHEAFLGRLVEENKLNPKNLDGSRKLIEVFHKVDLSNNHKVDKEELTTWIHDRILEHYDHALKINKESFKKIDKDDDGLVTLQEYMQGLTTDDKLQEDTLKLAEQSEEQLKGLMEEIMSEDLNRWNKADQNKDSKLNKEEFLAFQHPEHNKHSIEAMAEELLSQMDDDSNLVLTVDEFVRVPPGEVDDDAEKAEDEKYFNERRKEFSEVIDIDSDGKVSLDELKHYLDPRHKQHATKEAEYLISVADSNNDHELDENEMLANYKLFTGSSMADSPHMLHEEF